MTVTPRAPQGDWKTERIAMACNGELQMSTSKQFSTVNVKFIGVKHGESCETCLFMKFCHQQLDIKTDAQETPPTPPRPKGPSVIVLAFTGMPIGEFEITGEDEAIIEVTTRKGVKMVFDKANGLQLNCKTPRYANRIMQKPSVEDVAN